MRAHVSPRISAAPPPPLHRAFPPPQPPALPLRRWFTHIPKTGGTSFRQFLEAGASEHGWKFFDSLFLGFAGHPQIPIFEWKTADKWHDVEVALSAERPRLILHHHDGMPGLGNEELRRFLAATRKALDAKGCALTMVTVLRSPVARFISDLNFHRLSFGDEETRIYAMHERNFQMHYLLLNSHRQTAEDATLSLAETEKRCNPVKATLRAANGLKNYTCMTPAVTAEQASDALNLYDLVGNSAELEDLANAVSDRLGWPHKKIPHEPDAVVRRAVHDDTKTLVSAMNQEDAQLMLPIYEDQAASCNRSTVVAKAWSALSQERPLPRSIIYWKLKKVGGSTICNMLRDWADYKGRHFSYLRGALANSSNELQAKVVCNYNTATRTPWPYMHLRAEVQRTEPAMQIVTLREPAQQACSFFYWICALAHDEGDYGCGLPKEAELGNCTKKAGKMSCSGVATFVPSLTQVQRFWEKKWTQQALAPWRPDSIDSPKAVPAITSTEGHLRNTERILDQMRSSDPPLVLLFENFDDSVKLLQRKLGWTFEDEESLRHLYTHPTFEAWPEDARDFVKRRIEEARLDEVYAEGTRLFGQALEQEGIQPTPLSARRPFGDTHEEEGSDDVMPNELVSVQLAQEGDDDVLASADFRPVFARGPWSWWSAVPQPPTHALAPGEQE